MKVLILVLLGVSFVLATPAFADTIPFWTTSNVNYVTATPGSPNSHTFNGILGEAIIATAFTMGADNATHGQGINFPTGTPTGLYSKLGPPNGETGLGLASDINHEVPDNGFIRLDFSSAFLNQTLSLNLESVQSGECFTIYQGASGVSLPLATVISSHCGSGGGLNGTWDVSFNLSKGSSLYILGGGDSGGENITVASVTATRVSEPGGMVLLGTGLLSAAGIVRKKKIA